MEKPQKLSEKQKRFVDYYIETANASEAARRAGYSEKTANRIGAENLDKPHIKKAIEERMAEKDAERVASQDEILEFLTKVMRGEVTEQTPLLDGDGYQRLASKDMSAKDRVKAAEMLGKRYAMWTENKNIEGSIGVTFIDDIEDDIDLDDDADD